jgi:trimeric autotransporter adhesin
MSAHIDQELNTLFTCIAGTFGDEIGLAINERIDALVQLEGLDVANLQAQLVALNNLLSTNTSGDATNAQAVLAALAALDTRLDTLEGSTAVAELQAALAAAQAALTAEVIARQDADAAQAAAVGVLQTQVDGLAQSLVSIQGQLEQNQGGACDCTAIAASIASLSTSVANLSASDAEQATQIAALQASVEALSTQAAGIAAASAAAAAAQAAAAAAAQAAATAAVAAAAAQATADAAAAAAAAAGTSASTNAADIEAVKAALRGVNCVIVGGTFRTALRGRMGLALGQSNGSGNNH